ncbi:hypothetical protein HBI56_148010 [Parastagonospora nodorum]|uniref:Uncharacterized protein n=1 Tax=Phaeosphaeria nodorum (strain SN15 / ATCC MYA-4574 / FGSC 10173) TaxID=321614 RepID=A0A7U2IBN6_PHANO|nr:hypothetical protein HBH56_076840 [Parastagonospora nodorum]QRD06912.1 hypothetical protein JI435_423840 [Parastagonospora nodorum SN15]KAH3923372.1 hypothetical protein HBH54_211110 [Parastagonospora nodorum]KAH3952269.1 hypothetical protein HBH53_051280 [Parastagonospora nodorum]KAH3981603.1 hypothetical protein HBH51_043790 [Parastagonospora nodorum]
MNIQIVRSWHPALCLCPSFTDGFRHGFKLPLHLPSTSALCCAAHPPCSVGAEVSRLDRAFIAAWLRC